MKVVVVRSPRLLSGIFRLLFHIRKESDQEQ
ncbi:MAG: stage V sporulation protein SpoVM [Oscillospiraceae bacterium]|nr:stage V sporulation protein SpoVM [Oscillospiraceae bacterium]